MGDEGVVVAVGGWVSGWVSGWGMGGLGVLLYAIAGIVVDFAVGIDVVSIRHQVCLNLASSRHKFGIEFASSLHRRGIIWNPSGTHLGPIWDPFGTHSGSIWDYCGPGGILCKGEAQGTQDEGSQSPYNSTNTSFYTCLYIFPISPI